MKTMSKFIQCTLTPSLLSAVGLLMVLPTVEAKYKPPEKPVILLPVKQSALSPGQQLQNAVNDPANAGKVIKLEAGTYVLSPVKPDNTPNPVGGRLILQPDMDLIGANQYVDCDRDGVWDPINDCALIEAGMLPASESDAVYTTSKSATLIDGSLIVTPESIPRAPAAQLSTAVVRTGRNNRVARVTIMLPAAPSENVGGAIDISLLPASGGLSSTIEDCVLLGGHRGIRLNNGPAARNAIASAAIVRRNIVRGTVQVPTTLNRNGFGFAIQVQNGFSTGTQWDVIVTNNRLVQNPFGMFIVDNIATGNFTQVHSSNNLMVRNRTGMLLLGGFDGDAGGGLNNSMHITSHGDTFYGTEGAPFAGRGAGILAIGGANSLARNRSNAVVPASSGNELRLTLLEADFAGDVAVTNTPHLALIGYRSMVNRNAEGSGENNVLSFLGRRISGDRGTGSFLRQDNDVANGMVSSASNHVELLGSEVALDVTNTFFDATDWAGFEP